MPWQWDYDNYTGDNADMIGLFYPEDIYTILQIMMYENERRVKQAKAAEAQQRSKR